MAAVPREMVPGGMRTPALALAVLGAIIVIATVLAARVFRWE